MLGGDAVGIREFYFRSSARVGEAAYFEGEPDQPSAGLEHTPERSR